MQFIDLAAQQAKIRKDVEKRINAVLNHGKYIMGPEVVELEQRLAEFSGARFALTCANGTDALQLALMALKVGEGDAVFVPSFTFAATAEVVPLVCAKPVFVDVDPTSFNMDIDSLDRSVANARSLGLKPAAIIAVDLFGLPADYEKINRFARENNMKVISDSAQGFGSKIDTSCSGTFADVSTTSFFPAKPLGCYGDGGALFTEDEDIANAVKSLRVHGKSSHKYLNVRVGLNSRLDTMQAAILLAKLDIFDEEISARQEIAARYSSGLKSNTYATPEVPSNAISAWAQYTLRAPNKQLRDYAMQKLQDVGIPSMIYYPRPVHLQEAYLDFPRDPNGLSTSERLSKCVFSLPMHPYLRKDDQMRIIETLNQISLSE